MSRQEGLVALTLSFKSLQLRGYVDGAIAVVTNVKRYDANGVAGYQELILLLVVEGEGEDTAKFFEEVYSFVAIEC